MRFVTEKANPRINLGLSGVCRSGSRRFHCGPRYLRPTLRLPPPLAARDSVRTDARLEALQTGGGDVVFERRPPVALAEVFGVGRFSRVCQSAMGFRLLYGAQNSRPEHGNTVRERRGGKDGRNPRDRPGALCAVAAQRPPLRRSAKAQHFCGAFFRNAKAFLPLLKQGAATWFRA